MKLVNVLLVIVLYLTLIAYFFIKYKKRKFLFSVFNYNLYLDIFKIGIVPFFFFSNKAWSALGVYNISNYVSDLNYVWAINIIGFIIYNIFSIYFEFKNTKYYIPKILKTFSMNMKSAEKAIEIYFLATMIMFYFIVIVFNRGIPLINGNRTFINNYPSIRPLYKISFYLSSTICFFFALKYCDLKQKKYLVYLFLGVIQLLSTGNRTDALLNVLLPVIILFLYKLRKREEQKVKRVNWKIIKWGAGIFFLGIVISILRGGNINGNIISKLLGEIVYGNTFSDIRDGAFVKHAFDIKFDSFLMGKTYLAALISFIPSYISSFRQKWSWGYFSTMTLMNWKNHYGFRGGSFFEGYLNFGFIGVIVVALVTAWWNSNCEKYFYNYINNKYNADMTNDYFSIYIMQLIIMALVSSASITTAYLCSVFIIVIVIVNVIVRKGKFVILK